MIHRIWSHTENSGLNRVVHKSFQRGLQQVDTKSAYIGDKLYFREWIIKEFNRIQKFSQSYNNGIPFKNSRHKIDKYI